MSTTHPRNPPAGELKAGNEYLGLYDSADFCNYSDSHS